MAAVLLLAGCNKLNDSRIPSYPVRIEFNSQVWLLYGVQAIGDYRIFDRSSNIPSGFFNYDPDAYTGYGGVLLVSGYNFESNDYTPLAYDRACPYEVNRNTGLLQYDVDNNEAYCSNCGSRFDVIMGAGTPLSGPAAEHNYGLRRYTVRSLSSGGYIITNN